MNKGSCHLLLTLGEAMIKDKISYWPSMKALEFLDCYKWKSENK